MQSGCGAQVLAGHVIDSRLAGAVTVSLSVSQKEINGVLRSGLSVGDSILTVDAGRLHE